MLEITKTFLFSALMFAGLITAPSSASTPPAPPLSAYGELPAIEDAVLSPSGERLAALMTVEGNRMLVAYGADYQVISITNVQDTKVRSFRWVGDDRLLLTRGVTKSLGFGFTTEKHEFSQALIIPIDKSDEGSLVFGNKHGIVNAVFGFYGIREIDGKQYGFFGAVELARDGGGDYFFDHGRPSLYRVDFESQKYKRIAFAPRAGMNSDWLVGKNGELAATFLMNRETGEWTVRNSRNNIIAKGRSELGRGGLIGLTQGGGSVIYWQAEEDGSRRWLQVPLAGEEPTPFLEGVDVERLYFNRQTGELEGYLEEGNKPRPVFDDESKAEAIRKTEAAFARHSMSIMDWTDDFSNVIVRTTGQKDSGTWFKVDVENLNAKAFAYEREAIGPAQVGPFSTFEYTATDGLEMDGILTLPPDREAKNLPVVMFPHGGPHAYDSEQFDWWAQAFASRGYAVFQPNFRGSTNRGLAFIEAGYGEWGRKMQTDISDGLAALAEAGIVDPNRACIVGASYGGYAALAGVTLQQGLYKCAVAVAPVSDIRRAYREDYRASGKRRTTRETLRNQLGDPDTWDAVSPHRHAENADAPILLIHGKDDTVVPFVHSSKMADGLKDADKPHRLIALDGEDHWLSLSETRQRMLDEAVAFVEQHNPAQ
ncbi:MAG: S9 family peptidase [Erythrobacter sp.]|uniref:alpha/beta hydrolase family protein n=1 Tax=Erythrobacter sp. TaxID=1042 RepID=UPI003296C485